MDENTLKKLLNEAITPLREDIKDIKEDVATVKEDVAGIKETQGDHTKRLEVLSGDMEQVLTEVKATHDEIGLWHQRDKREIDEIKEHLDLPLQPDIPQV